MTSKKVINELKREVRRLEGENGLEDAEMIRLRNLKRWIAMTDGGRIFCPAEGRDMDPDEVVRCMFCQYGHMTECHYPYTCDSGFCNH